MNTDIALRRRWRLTFAGRTTDRGSATVFVVAFAGVLFACAGLAIDGGRAINARDRVNDVAEQAARAGAGQLDDASLRAVDGTVVLDGPAARSEAEGFVEQANAAYRSNATIALDGGSVTVRVEWTYPTAILGIIGINSIPVSGTATAGPATGVGP
jgi:Flp pilus assembly protein TadG